MPNMTFDLPSLSFCNKSSIVCPENPKFPCVHVSCAFELSHIHIITVCFTNNGSAVFGNKPHPLETYNS